MTFIDIVPCNQIRGMVRIIELGDPLPPFIALTFTENGAFPSRHQTHAAARGHILQSGITAKSGAAGRMNISRPSGICH